jgi:CIC family chloride channel protein
MVGGLVWLSYGTLVGHGHLAVQLELFGRMSWYALAGLAIGKIVVTSITMHGGGTGGVFTPSLYLGAVTGGSVGVLLALLFPQLGLHPESFALVGMGAVVAGATAAPLTGILIVFEMTNDYAIMLPLMLATAVSYVIARRFEQDSLYSGWLRRRGERLQSGASRDVLAGLRVADVVDSNPRTVAESATLAEMLAQLDSASENDFPVVDGDSRLCGMISVVELGRIVRDTQDLADMIIAADIVTPTVTVRRDETLLDVVRKMGVQGAGTLPVVDAPTGRLIGVVTRAHVLAMYERAVARAAVV